MKKENWFALNQNENQPNGMDCIWVYDFSCYPNTPPFVRYTK